DADLAAAATEQGAGIVAWSPLGGGFLTGALDGVGDGDLRAELDRFSPANLATNNERYAPVRELSVRCNVSPGQLALAWLLHQHPSVVPIPGSRNPAHIDENLAAAAIVLSPD